MILCAGEAGLRRGELIALQSGDLDLRARRGTVCHSDWNGIIGPPKAIQELAGHASITTTMRYMHLAPAVLEEAIDLLEKRGDESARPQEGGRSPWFA